MGEGWKAPAGEGPMGAGVERGGAAMLESTNNE